MQRVLLVLVASVVIPVGLHGGIFDRKPKSPGESKQAAPAPSEAERVETLISTLLLAKESDQRERAAEMMAKLNAQKSPAVVSALIEAAKKDGDACVRREAVKSLGKIRPTSSEAQQALEEAGKDESYRVRLEARLARLGYRVTEPPAPMPPAAGNFIKVPPAGPDGRLKPVPIPSPEELNKPVVKEGPSLSRPVPINREKEGVGPLLLPPRQ
jgi:hypothetical protein